MVPHRPHPPVASLWLLAAGADETALADEIRRLATRHECPVFHPHLTVLGDIPADPADCLAGSRAVAAAAPPFAVPVDDIVTGEAFYRSFYALFAAVPELLALRQAAIRQFRLDPGPFMPHVSLLYGPVEAAAKAASRAETASRWQGRPLRFDRLAITNSGNDVPIAGWHCVEIIPLSG